MFNSGAIRLSRVTAPVVAGGIALLVVALEAFLGTQVARVGDNQTLLKLIAMVIPTLGALALMVARFEIGVILLPVVAVALPLSIGTGTQSVLVVSLLFAGFVVALGALRAIVRHEPMRVGPLVTLPALGFLLTIIVSTLWSEVARSPLVTLWATFAQVQLATVGVFIISVGTLLVTMHSVRDLRWIRYLIWVFLLIGAVTIVGYLLRSRQDLPGVEVGGMFSLWVVAMAYGQALLNRRIPNWGRAGLLLLVGAWLFRRLFWESFWLSGWVPMIVALVVISLLRPRPLSMLVLGGLAIGALVQFDTIYNIQFLGSESGGNFLRTEIWSQNLEVTKNHLLLGTGAAGYAPYYMTFYPNNAYSSHSNLLDVFSQTGLIGSFFFAWLLISLLVVGFRAQSRWTAGFGGGFAVGALGALVGLMVAMLLGDWLIPFVYTQTIAGFRHTVHSWVLLGALASLWRIRAE